MTGKNINVEGSKTFSKWKNKTFYEGSKEEER